jgi:hypothetical protein
MLPATRPVVTLAYGLDATMVAWARVTEGSADAAEVFADFGQMLAGVRFR